MGDFGIGAAVRRKEDLRFLTGQGTYTDDINRPGQLHAFLLRSPHAHALLGAVDVGAAKASLSVYGFPFRPTRTLRQCRPEESDASTMRLHPFDHDGRVCAYLLC